MPKAAQPEFTVEYLDPRDLKPHPANPARHPSGQMIALGASLKEHGYLSAPIWNRRSGRLVDGHARVELAVESEERLIPVRVIDVDEAQEKRILASFNRIGDLRETDDAQLAALLSELAETSEGLPAGWEETDLEVLLTELRTPAEGSGDGSGAEFAGLLTARFGVPPFSVLDARQGYWQERKRAWVALGIESEVGRGDVMPSGASSVYAGSSEWSGYRGPARLGEDVTTTETMGQRPAPGRSARPAAKRGAKTVRGDGAGRPMASSPGRCFGQDLMRGEHVVGEKRLTWVPGDRKEDDLDETSRKNLAAGEQSGTSIFDPVLCELAYRWFCPERGRVLDPFAGGSVRGIVASVLGRSYTGVDLRPEQIAANEQQAERIGVTPDWRCGDSRQVVPGLDGPFDFIFSSPPYAGLERYSDRTEDLSTMEYPAFLEAYRAIVAAAAAKLKEDRFAFFVVGDVRDPKGFYYNFVSDTIAAFQDAGMRLYNEAILVTAVGSLSIRVGKQFGTYRKLGKTHQNCLIFYRGDPKKIQEIAADCQFGELGEEEGAADGE